MTEPMTKNKVIFNVSASNPKGKVLYYWFSFRPKGFMFAKDEMRIPWAD